MQKQHSKEFKEQVLRKNRERGTRTQQSIADELNISLGTLKGWVKHEASIARVPPLTTQPSGTLAPEVPAHQYSPAQRLLALHQTHGLGEQDLHAWCREKGLFAHQLQAWREAFCSPLEPHERQSRGALRELQAKHDQLQRQLQRKDKVLAEAAALLVLQKKFQALWVDEV